MAAAAHSPLEQFTIARIIPIHIGRLDLSYTNAALLMTIAVALATLLLVAATARPALVPSRLQSVAELLYEFVAGMVRDTVGDEGRRYFPLVFSIFIFILFGNLLGLVPYSFTFTGQIIVTFASQCDTGYYHGYVLAFDETSLQPTGAFVTTPDGY